MASSWHHFLSASSRSEAAGAAHKDEAGRVHHTPAPAVVPARVGKHLILVACFTACPRLHQSGVTDAAM